MDKGELCGIEKSMQRGKKFLGNLMRIGDSLAGIETVVKCGKVRRNVAQMKAVVKQRKGEGFVELVEVPEPVIGDTDILVAVNATGICGSDLMILHDFFPGYNAPVILGHEFAGVVKETGKASSKFSTGDRVVCETHAYVCNNCVYCRSWTVQPMHDSQGVWVRNGRGPRQIC